MKYLALFLWLFCTTPLNVVSYAGELAVEKKPVLIDRLEASVNSSLVLLSDVEVFRKTVKLRSQLDPLFAGTPLASTGSNMPIQQIVKFLADESLITQAFPKTDAEVEAEIATIQKNNRLDRTSLKEALEREGFSFSEYSELMRDSASKRDMIRQDIQTKIAISDDDVKNYFYNHYARTAGASRAFHLAIISISEKSFKKSGRITTRELAHNTAVEALKSIRAGERFEEVAKRVSDGVTASSGGDLGILTEDLIQPFIKTQANKLKIGEVSDVFGNSGQFYILKLVDIQSNQNEQLAKMKEEIRNQLAAQEYQRQVELWLERNRQTAFIHLAGEPAISNPFNEKK